MAKMYRKQTDLALEGRELHPPKGKEDGLLTEKRSLFGIPVTELTVLAGDGERNSGKPAGNYLTLDIGDAWQGQKEAFDSAADAIAELLFNLLPRGNGCVLVAGLGNRQLASDSLGPLTVDHILVTRHIRLLDGHIFDCAGWGEVAAIAPGVLAQTGVESAEIVQSVVEKIRPRCVIAVDALASRRLARLASTVQLSDTGISPGAGVSNHRGILNRNRLGVPVISMGIPTVVDAATLAYDLLEEVTGEEAVLEKAVEKLLETGAGKNFFVSPKDGDVLSLQGARLLAAGINLALHPGMTLSDLADLRRGI